MKSRFAPKDEMIRGVPSELYFRFCAGIPRVTAAETQAEPFGGYPCRCCHGWHVWHGRLAVPHPRHPFWEAWGLRP